MWAKKWKGELRSSYNGLKRDSAGRAGSKFLGDKLGFNGNVAGRMTTSHHLRKILL